MTYRKWVGWTAMLVVCLMLGLSSAVLSGTPPGLSHGPVVGGVTPTSAAVFVRTSASGSNVMRMAPSSGSPIDTPFATTAGNDFTAVVSVSGLSPSTSYTVTVLGSPQRTTFTTFPDPSSTAPITLLYLTDFQGPTGSPKEPSGIFALAATENPAVLLLGGDFDHSNPGAGFPKGSSRNLVIGSYRTMFKRLYDPKQMSSFVLNILNKMALAHMLDDHDYGNNDEDKDFKWRDSASQVFKEFVPTYPLAAPVGSQGLWQRFSYAYVDIFLVDTRSQRTHHGALDDSQKSMLDGNFLGASGQLQWLKDGLRTSTAVWKILLMPTPFNPTVIKKSSVPPSSQDSWTGYQTERGVLLRYLAENQVQNVVMLSGDLHAGAIDDGTNSGVVEMLTPAVNFTPQSPERCLSADFIGIWSHGTYVRTNPRVCNGYGVVHITPTQVDLQVKDETGVTRLMFTVAAR